MIVTVKWADSQTGQGQGTGMSKLSLSLRILSTDLLLSSKTLFHNIPTIPLEHYFTGKW